MNRSFDIHNPPRWFIWLTLIPSLLYGLAMRFRSAFYTLGLLRSHQLNIPVLSVGNLTVGGTGKTPVTAFLAGYFQKQGWKPVIISRGYGRSTSDPAARNTVSTPSAKVRTDAAVRPCPCWSSMTGNLPLNR